MWFPGFSRSLLPKATYSFGYRLKAVRVSPKGDGEVCGVEVAEVVGCVQADDHVGRSHV